MSDDRKTFALRFHQDGPALVGSRWWNESFERAPWRVPEVSEQRRSALGGLVVGGFVLFGIASKVCSPDDGGGCSSESTSLVDAVEVQRGQGWDVGASNGRPRIRNAVAVDVDGSVGWRAALLAPSLADRLRPADARLAPYYVPTLFSVLSHPSGARLAAATTPMASPQMQTATLRGRALRELFTDASSPADVALVLDLPGPESVALAASLANAFAPVFQFDNWPHPHGVVRSEETIAAALYHLPDFERSKDARRAGAPPMFVLDANRLAPYTDRPDLFDNRYVSKLPKADALQALGVKRVFYVQPSSGNLQDLDDVNADLVAWERAGLLVQTIGVDDLKPASGAPVQAERRYYYGGSPTYHTRFWTYYRSPVYAGSFEPPPSMLARGPGWRPRPRSTLFSAGVRPNTFGRLSVVTSGGGSTRSYSYRSGSFGRSRSSWGG